MNVEQVGTLVRTVAQMGAAYAIGRGWLDQTAAGDLVAGAVALGTLAYGIYARRNAALLASADKVAAKAG
ncbi:Pam3-gp28 family putative phage holin [Methylobacterium frigidaeris]|uniref:Holin n=1 Tax=Methylobacterium frigidaeris TaxID=2038277 RepID=A0AA37HGL6_9HYPH|nr:hypothetical protein [Methylobacterium frigidaeris]PIK70162.1 hypothetical protein CS379_26155 [Methylobacterium frigidaeris]GJD65194.1 hypothetical protein MPEAHAMD_5381 [Methylobacterium frigidaeris]